MGSVIDGGYLLTTSNASNVSSSKGLNAGDLVETTGSFTSGMIVTIWQSSGGTCAAGITSGSEYMLIAGATTTSFQLYAYGGSSAVEVTADSTGTDYMAQVIGSNVVPVKGFDCVTISFNPTSSYDGEWRFVGSMKSDLDPDGRLTTGNDFYYLAYDNLSASSNPVIGTTYFDSSGGTATGYHMFRIDTRGIETLVMRSRNFVSGGVTAKFNAFQESAD